MSVLTLEEICKQHVKVSPKALDQECREEGQDILADYCGDWEEVARKLFPSDTVDNLIDDVKKKKPKNQRSEFVRRWREEYGHTATYKKFFEALLALKFTRKVENGLKKLKEKKLLQRHDADSGSLSPTEQPSRQPTSAHCDDSGSLSPTNQPPKKPAAADHEEPIYTEEKEKELILKHKPDPLPVEEEKELKSFRKEINVIIHVVNEYEFGAATTYITAPNQSDGNGIRFRGYVLGMFAGQKVALVQTGPGADCYEDIQSAMNELSLDVQYIFGVGVCYSLDCEKHHFGDVLVANRISSFETQKKRGSDILPRGERIDISQDLRKIFCQQTIYWDDTFEVSRNRSSKAYCGLFISMSTLLSSSEEGKKLKHAEREAIGGEMEGFKLMKMKRSNGLPMEVIVIKGVVDYGDESKDKVWQFTTAMAAFNFVKKMIVLKGADFSKSTEHQQIRGSSNGSTPLPGSAVTPTSGNKRLRGEEELTGPKQKKSKGNRVETDSSKVQEESDQPSAEASKYLHHDIIIDETASSPTIKQVFKHLLRLSSEWKTIGTLLDLDSANLSAIEKDYSTSIDRLREMINLWMKQINPRPTWTALIDAVQEVNPNKAEEIRQALLNKCKK